MPRPSPVRDALREIFSAEEHQALTLEELLERVRSMIGAADYSTVFRASAVLESEGIIQRVDLGDGLSRYESRREHHEHVRCDSCGRVAEVPGCVLEDAAREIEASTGYRLERHSLVFMGVCPECATAR
jgi:Fur family ferric uptake transcriptional regulator